MKDIKILIVGGGPAGSACAIRCRQLGMECMVVDKAKFPRKKLCGGLLTIKTREAMTALLGEEGLRTLLDESMVNTTHEFAVFYGYNQVAKCTPTMPMQLVSRVLMDNHLLRKAESMGAEVSDGNGLKTIDFEKKVATLVTGEEVRYEYLVAADGAASLVEILLSRVARDFKKKGHNALAVEVDVKVEDAAMDHETLGIHFGVMKKGYACTFPRGEFVTYGVAKPFDHKDNLKEKLREYMIAKGVKNVDSYPITGCCIPWYNQMKEPVWHQHVIFVGDAAGLVDPLTGEGICYALQSGMHAATSIHAHQTNGTDPARCYEELVTPIRKLLKSGGRIEKLMSSSIIMRSIKNHAAKRVGFMNFFYDEFIDKGSTASYLELRRRYKRT